MDTQRIRLTRLAHGGGCGCKLAPAVLEELRADLSAAMPFQQLLVGTETGDRAAAWPLDDNTCIITTTDFFMLIVDDPFDFGRIAMREDRQNLFRLRSNRHQLHIATIRPHSLGALSLQAARGECT